ncbi:hypothetical protein ACH5RR_026105 [Cinchona calisaya]|uniref:Uncharacterized protein n=1 Tax=Cinchona calisaya TaxID=153742 RepID=A0ABD2Z1J9_9GENT
MIEPSPPDHQDSTNRLPSPLHRDSNLEQLVQKMADHSISENLMSEHEVLETPDITSSCKMVLAPQESLALAADIPLAHADPTDAPVAIVNAIL